MKKLFFITSFILLILSCDSTLSLEENNKNSILNARISGEANDFIFERFGANVSFVNDSVIALRYSNDRIINIIQDNLDTNFYKIQGSLIGEAVFGIRHYNNNTFEFIVIHDYNDEFKPCKDHPTSESFDDCFAREWDDFCRDMVGCVLQSTQPVLVATLIAIHCIDCD